MLGTAAHLHAPNLKPPTRRSKSLDSPEYAISLGMFNLLDFSSYRPGRLLMRLVFVIFRKGVTKANAKHEPTVFRDQLIKHLESVPPQDYDAVAAKLDALGNQVSWIRSALPCVACARHPSSGPLPVSARADPLLSADNSSTTASMR